MRSRIEDINLAGLLEARFRAGEPAWSALGYLGITRYPKRRLTLTSLLRDHREESVPWEPTGRMREAVDVLLEVADIVEIGALAGVYPAQPKHPKIDLMVKALSLPEMKRYYTEYYPIALPPLFLKRATGERNVAVPPNARLLAAFTAMLNVDAAFFGDEDIANYFLGLLDGYDFEGENSTIDARQFWVGLSKLLSNPPSLVRLVTEKSSDSEPTFNAACRGFLRFTELIRPMNDLLDSLARWPRVRAAVWLHYGYWFTEMRADFETLFKQLRFDIEMRAKIKLSSAKAKVIDKEMKSRAEGLSRLCRASDFALVPWGTGHGDKVVVPLGGHRYIRL